MSTSQRPIDSHFGEIRLPAVAVSRGVGTGKLVFLSGEKRKHFRRDVDAGQAESEVARFITALDVAVYELKRLAAESAGEGRSSASEIFDVQAMILESSVRDKVVESIRLEKVDAEWAIRKVADNFIERQRSVADARFREKSVDIEDAIDRLFVAIQAADPRAKLLPGCVVATGELRPSVLIEIAKCNPSAVIIEHGGWTSHVSIIARELKVPMVSGIKDLSHSAKEGDNVMVDGVKGEIVINPSSESINTAELSIASFRSPLITSAGHSKRAVTTDNVRIIIRANTDTASSYAVAHENGAEGVGLFRSESILSRSGSFPSEEEQFFAYREIADAAGINGVKIRTFDIGAVQNDDRRTEERNPALGLRAIRYGLTNLNVFRTQIRAILRASYERKVDIVFPMISGVKEILIARSIIAAEVDSLTEAGHSVGEPRIGAMIETPSAVITAKAIAKHVDLMCIGTNDLVQYLLAVDRDNEAVADWYQSLHPAVLWAIQEVISIADEAKMPVSVCGEMAGSPFYVPLLLALGVREFSMNAASIEPVLRLINSISVSECRELATILDNVDTADDIQSKLSDHYRLLFPDLFPPGLLAENYL